MWFYATLFGSTINLPTTGPGNELDFIGGFKWRGFSDRLGLDVGYIRYTYPGVPAALGYNWGEFNLNGSWDFGGVTLAGRLRYSRNAIADSGVSWNKRGLVSVPFELPLPFDVRFKAYASVGNVWVEKFLIYGIPGSEYWYWQGGLVARSHGFEVMVAYTDTNIAPSGCGYTASCSGRVFVSLTKVF